MEITQLRHIKLGELHLVKPDRYWIQILVIRELDCAAQPTSFVTSPVAIAIKLLWDNHQQDELLLIEQYSLWQCLFIGSCLRTLFRTRSFFLASSLIYLLKLPMPWQHVYRMTWTSSFSKHIVLCTNTGLVHGLCFMPTTTWYDPVRSNSFR